MPLPTMLTLPTIAMLPTIPTLSTHLLCYSIAMLIVITIIMLMALAGKKGWWRCPTFLGRFLPFERSSLSVIISGWSKKCPHAAGGIAHGGPSPSQGRKVVIAAPSVSLSLYPVCSYC